MFGLVHIFAGWKRCSQADDLQNTITSLIVLGLFYVIYRYIVYEQIYKPASLKYVDKPISQFVLFCLYAILAFPFVLIILGVFSALIASWCG